MEQIRWIIKWFEKHTSLSENELLQKKDQNYLEEELLDSFGLIELISDLEEELGIELTETDFISGDIFTINGLIKKVEKTVIHERLSNEK